MEESIYGLFCREWKSDDENQKTHDENQKTHEETQKMFKKFNIIARTSQSK